MFGWIAVPMIPPIRMWTPMTASSSAWRPAGEVGRLAEHERQDGEPGAERDHRLEQLDREVRPVLQLVERADPEEEPEQRGRSRSAEAVAVASPCQPPTAENRLIAIAPDASDARASAITIQSTWIRSPPMSSSGGSSPISASIGKPNVHLNGRKLASCWAQSGISGERHEPTRQQQLRGEEDVEHRPDPGRPERHEAERQRLSERMT